MSLLRERSYERPEGFEIGHPSVFIDDQIVDEFGLPDVDYDNLARLHRDEIPNSPTDMPVTYIARRSLKYDNPAHAREPKTKLSHDSKRRGHNIHINLRTFPFSGENQVTTASSACLARELILQSAARAVIKNNRFIRRADLIHELWFPVELGIVSGYIASLPWSELTGIEVGAAAFGISAPSNLLELRDTRVERIRSLAVPVVENLIDCHRNDFVFPTAADL